jgi:hypothetical protein
MIRTRSRPSLSTPQGPFLIIVDRTHVLFCFYIRRTYKAHLIMSGTHEDSALHDATEVVPDAHPEPVDPPQNEATVAQNSTLNLETADAALEGHHELLIDVSTTPRSGSTSPSRGD